MKEPFGAFPEAGSVVRTVKEVTRESDNLVYFNSLNTEHTPDSQWIREWNTKLLGGNWDSG